MAGSGSKTDNAGFVISSAVTPGKVSESFREKLRVHGASDSWLNALKGSTAKTQSESGKITAPRKPTRQRA